MAEASGRFCKNCRFCLMAAESQFAKCVAPQNIITEIDYVTGVPACTIAVSAYAQACRESTRAIACGPEAKWFQPRDEQVAA